MDQKMRLVAVDYNLKQSMWIFWRWRIYIFSKLFIAWFWALTERLTPFLIMCHCCPGPGEQEDANPWRTFKLYFQPKQPNQTIFNAEMIIMGFMEHLQLSFFHCTEWCYCAFYSYNHAMTQVGMDQWFLIELPSLRRLLRSPVLGWLLSCWKSFS